MGGIEKIASSTVAGSLAMIASKTG